MRSDQPQHAGEATRTRTRAGLTAGGRRRGGMAGLTAVALAAPLAMIAAAAPAVADESTPRTEPVVGTALASDTRVDVTSGHLDWGVRTSIRNYLENFGHTEGHVAAYDGATYQRGDTAARFPDASGWVDVENDEAELSFDGRFEMYGFGAWWLHFENVRVGIAEGEATITVDMRESFGTREPVANLTLATFELDGDDVIQERDGVITIESDEGVFPEHIGAEHLPRMDGEATYGGDNGYTDPFAIVLNTDTSDDEPVQDPDEEEPQPGPNPDDEQPVTVPRSGAYGESSAKNRYGAELTVSPAYSLADEGQTVHLTGKNFPTVGPGNTKWKGGLYVLFGWVDPAAGEDWGPGHGGASGHTFTYTKDIEPQGTYQSMVNYPGNTTAPGFPEMDANGNFEMDLPLLASRFESAQGMDVDCYKMQCGVLLIGAHGQINAQGEIFVPVYFTETADGTGNETPAGPGDGGPTANPNMTPAAGGPAAQNGGLSVNGGLAMTGVQESGRAALFGGALLMSAGLLGAALLFHRRRKMAAPPDGIATELDSMHLRGNV
ncbi:HtaA domain-containing protein [Microbacterium sp.]|uniref:HtaA domain-containing protein n=1 Tax=Microbacterium sp. TaxID=51671 RepID=UPI003F9AF4F7